METPPNPPPPDQGSGTLATAVVLSAVAGWVDAHIYLHVNEVFVANMSGNLIALGMFVGLANWSEVWPSAAAIGAFVAGVALGTHLNRRTFRSLRSARTRVLLAIEAVMLATLAAGLLVTPGHAARHTWFAMLALICVGAAAMGLQAAALGRVGAIAVTTTYGTGSLVRVGQRLVRPAAGVPDDHSARNRLILVLVSLLCGYVGAAAVSALVGGAAWLMLLPVVALAATSWWSGPSPAAAPTG